MTFDTTSEYFQYATLLFVGIFAAITLAYSWLIGYFAVGLNKLVVKTDQGELSVHSLNQLTVIIPFRNEENNLPHLLHSLQNQQGNGGRFILVDDHSIDNSVGVIKAFLDKESVALAFDLKTNKGQGKKAAIETGVHFCQTDYFVLTDADCEMNAEWLVTIAEVIKKKSPDLLILPVRTKNENSWFNKFQEMDFLALVGCTFGAGKYPFMCNAANLVVKRESFLKVNPFVGNQNIPTGDDVFLLHTFKRESTMKIQMNLTKNLWVETKVAAGFKGFMKQRARWGSKTINYQDKFTWLVALVVLLQSLLLITSLVLWAFADLSFLFFATSFGLKLVVDFVLIRIAANYFDKQYLLPLILPASVLNFIFIPLLAFAGIWMSLKKYNS